MKFADDHHLTPIGIRLKRFFEHNNLTPVDLIVIGGSFIPAVVAFWLVAV